MTTKQTRLPATLKHEQSSDGTKHRLVAKVGRATHKTGVWASTNTPAMLRIVNKTFFAIAPYSGMDAQIYSAKLIEPDKTVVMVNPQLVE